MKKDLNWLKDEILTDMRYLEGNREIQQLDIKYQTLREVAQKINSLDEPETLSQELPVIPRFVGDWIEEVKKQNKSLVFAIAHIYDKNEIGESPNEEENRIFQWMELDDNEEVFARAWLDGYEVEEEQKYYVLNEPTQQLILHKKEGNIYPTVTDFEYFARTGNEDYLLSEKEIKDYNPSYMAFAVKVEELEE